MAKKGKEGEVRAKKKSYFSPLLSSFFFSLLPVLISLSPSL